MTTAASRPDLAAETRSLLAELGFAITDFWRAPAR